MKFNRECIGYKKKCLDQQPKTVHEFDENNQSFWPIIFFCFFFRESSFNFFGKNKKGEANKERKGNKEK